MSTLLCIMERQVSSESSGQEDKQSESGSALNSLEYQPDSKDEYLEDPLPDLVGSLRITEEPEPDLTSCFEQEFILEDFEINANSSDEDDVDPGLIDSDSSDDIEFYDVAKELGANQRLLYSKLLSHSTDLLENEKVSVELDSASLPEEVGVSDEGGSSSSGLKKVREKAEKVAARVKGIVGKRRNKFQKNIRVLYQNLDKPYSAKVTPSQHFKKFLTLGQGLHL